MFSPGDDSPGHETPIVNALPCRIGDARQLDVPPQRYLSLVCRRDLHMSPFCACLNPRTGSEPLGLFKGAVAGYSCRFGLGQILVVPLTSARSKPMTPPTFPPSLACGE